jgi:membrane fusion protein (multidrug efflux system)
MWRRALCSGIGAIVLFGVTLSGCRRVPNADQPPATATSPAVTVVEADLKSVTPFGTFVGRVKAVNTVNLVSRIEGLLQERAFMEGQPVKTGDLLFLIEQDTYRAAVAQAEAALGRMQATERNAAVTLQRSQELVKTNAVSQATVDQNVANQGAAEADVTGQD